MAVVIPNLTAPIAVVAIDATNPLFRFGNPCAPANLVSPNTSAPILVVRTDPVTGAQV